MTFLQPEVTRALWPTWRERMTDALLSVRWPFYAALAFAVWALIGVAL